jgi:hypothetical protein
MTTEDDLKSIMEFDRITLRSRKCTYQYEPLRVLSVEDKRIVAESALAELSTYVMSYVGPTATKSAVSEVEVHDWYGWPWVRRLLVHLGWISSRKIKVRLQVSVTPNWTFPALDATKDEIQFAIPKMDVMKQMIQDWRP